MDVASLSKCNVSQLKTKCKELKLAGYSKLAKTALIEKLVKSGLGASGGTSGATESAVIVQGEPPISTISSSPAQAQQSNHANTDADAQGVTQTTLGSDVPSTSKKPIKKRPRKDEGESAPPRKPKKMLIQNASQGQPVVDIPQESGAPCASSSIVPVPPLDASPEVSRRRSRSIFQVSPLPKAPVPTSYSVTDKNEPPTKSLEPLPAKSSNAGAKVTNPTPASKTNPSTRNIQIYKPKKFKAPTIIRPTRINLPNKPQVPACPARPPHPLSCAQQSLDFPPPPTCTSYPRISMPPSMSRRRQAERMSVVFSGIADCSVLSLCVQVSRAWRYAVYLSATHTLVRELPGSRLNTVLAGIKEPRMTSMWAYLRERQAEGESRRGTFEQTWLGRCLQREDVPVLNRSPISMRMWTSPDDERQIVVALRFVCTRLVFALARRHDNSFDVREWLDAMVVGADEVVPNEIWRVTTIRNPGTKERHKQESFYILFDTGEVIGHAPSLPRNPRNIFGQRVVQNRPHLEIFDEEYQARNPLRTDWAKYIEAVERGDAPSLQDAITSADRESYVCGISAFWLRGLAKEKDGDLLKTIARRYVLSCVEPNSVSGAYKTVLGMARGLAGGGLVDQSIPMKRQPLGLLVSEHHLVESVHLAVKAPSAGTRLHPALALALTAPGREYFVLRDTGTPIGTSDEGLEAIWQEVLDCDAWGCVGI